jgi:hypothetical protein
MSSTKDTLTSTTKTILTSSANWEDWNDRFVSQAIMYDLLGHIQGRDHILPKPVRPVMTEYAQRTRSRPTPARRPGQGASGQGASEELTLSPDPESDPRGIAFSDLTADGQKSFSMAWTFYQDDLKAYEKQQELVRKLKEWISANVSSHYQKTCCKPTESLAKWYEQLKKAAGISKRLEDSIARERYREALKTPKMKDLSSWIDLWEQEMTVAEDKGVLATTRVSEWFEDLLVAVRGILPTWAESYGINKDPFVEDNTLDYRTVANDLRKVASRHTRTGIPGKIAKGSFGPTFAGEENQHAGSEEAPKRGDEDGTKRKRGRQSKGKQGSEVLPDSTASQKRKTASDEVSGKVCRGCEGYHWTQRCFYLFPKKAPEGWIPNPRIQKIVEQKLKEDSTLEEEIKRLTKTGPTEEKTND